MSSDLAVLLVTSMFYVCRETQRRTFPVSGCSGGVRQRFEKACRRELVKRMDISRFIEQIG